MSRLIASITAASLFALAACGSPKTEEAPAAEAPPAAVMPDDTMPTEMEGETDELTPMPTEPVFDDEDLPGNAGNDKGRAG